jgi:hypothetical protein
MFSDMLLNACDSYLDASACKQYTTSIFDTPAPSHNASSECDTREEIMATRDMEMNESQRAEKMEKSPCPLVPMALVDGSEDDVAVRRSADTTSKDVFRLNRSNDILGGERGYAEFSTLCRCAAWSMDSNGSASGIEEAYSYHSAGRRDRPVDLVHWDEILSDSGELKGQFVVSMD